MKLIVGLGNPGRIYIDSRHNIGFTIVRALSRIYKIPLKKDSNAFCLSGKGKLQGHTLLLALPLTFMNLSGSTVSALLKKYKIGLKDLLVVYDDLDLGLGTIRIRPSGSSGGHHGLKSIIESIGSQEFSRLRIGIGRPLKDNIDPVRNSHSYKEKNISNGVDTASFVLSPFTKKEQEKLKEIIESACECCRIWVMKGITESMNIFNRRSQDI